MLNGFSLSESGALSSAIERTGQAADSTFMATGQMVSRILFFIRAVLLKLTLSRIV